MYIHDVALLGRVGLGALLGFLLGWEREVRGHPAGSRTFAIVSAASAALSAVALDAFPATAEKLIAGIVTGIGFIGAGIVLRDPSGHVKGLTTAAAIWAVASVGIIAGAARFVLAVGTAAVFLVILELPSLPLLRIIDAQRWAHRFRSDTAPPGEPSSDA